MSMGSMGIAASVAGAPLAQAKSDVDRTQHASSVQDRRVQGIEKTAAAAGVAATDSEDKQAHERDADGRRLWEEMGGERQEQHADADQAGTPAGGIKDPTGERGGLLDLSG